MGVSLTQLLAAANRIPQLMPDYSQGGSFGPATARSGSSATSGGNWLFGETKSEPGWNANPEIWDKRKGVLDSLEDLFKGKIPNSKPVTIGLDNGATVQRMSPLDKEYWAILSKFLDWGPIAPNTTTTDKGLLDFLF